MQKCYAIKDVKADCAGQLLQARTNAEALRLFEDLANDPQTAVGRHPEDFVLFLVGEWDEQAVRMTGLEAPISLAIGTDLKKEES